MRIKACGITDKGLQRSGNEDCFAYSLHLPDWSCEEGSCIELLDTGSVFVVADGMGGETAGNIASSLAVDAVKKCFSTAELHEVIGSEEVIFAFLRQVVAAANDVIMEAIQKDPNLFGMGTTIVICWVLKTRTYIAWCGDSRCYLFDSQRRLKCLTKDHSLVQELIDSNTISEADSYTHPDSGVITRCLGGDGTTAIPGVVACDIHPREQLLLCSDGLCGYCSNKNIQNVLRRESSDIKKTCKALLQLALEVGGYDNITIVNIELMGNDENNSRLSLKERVREWMNFHCCLQL